MIVIAILLVVPIAAFHNLQVFFNQTYDTNHDGYGTIQQLVKFFQRMEPQHNITLAAVAPIFDFFDSDCDSKVTLNELLEIAKIKWNVTTGHKQIHLGLTSQPNQMQVMWVSTPEKYHSPVIYYGHSPLDLHSHSVDAIISTYSVGHLGFHGSIYRGVIKNLMAGKRYYYKVGDRSTGTFSEVKHFRAPYPPGSQVDTVTIAIFGDMGTFAPFGHLVINQIVHNHLSKPFDVVFLTGDIAYAGISSENQGEIQPIWDLFGELTQKFAAYVPFMPGVGNHQKYYNYSSYLNRYVLPKHYPDQPNFWFCFDYGRVHFIHFSSEHPYGKGSQQYQFIENDLKRVRNSYNTDWIILAAHRPFYCSNTNQYSPITPLTSALEDLANQYQVDIVQDGHIHAYERTWPVFRGKPQKEGHNETHYISPKTPIYVVQGTAGAFIKSGWVKPHPQWSLRRILSYGYGRITIKGNTLKYQFIGAPHGTILDEWHIIK